VAIPTLTYYSVSADLTTLSAVLNGVAMICQQNALIWGFAFAVGLWRLLSTATSAALKGANGQGGAVLASGSMSAFMPFILAMTLTNPMLQGTVQLESTINGAVTEVDHVPLAISAIPAFGSVLSQNLNQLFSTAFQNVDAEYPAISATANGFLNPLKVLLTSRTAMVRLGGVDSEVKTVLAACLGPDSGVNYANIQNLVMNAGNTGATTSQSIEINGTNPTALGALLYQASLNTSGMVNDPGLNATNMLSCSAAANQVANDVTNALNSVEFTRVIQGAVNGMDSPVPGADYSFNTVASQYNAVTTANTLGGVFAGGTGQSNAEFMNLIFSEMVQNDLNCLRASSDTLTECEATALQASEVERNNLQQAASEVPMLRYAGSFGNYLIALIIGLGPVIIMFMMFAGVDAGKCVKTAAHIMVWPLLVVNVGAELVNGMLCIDVANYLQSIRQGGWLSQATTLAAYKELSLQIGVGSHIMASLPVLMSLIFGLGESSAMTSVATTIAAKSRDVEENLAPTPASTRPMFENSSVGTISQLGNGSGKLAMQGSLDAVSTTSTFGNSVRDAGRVLTQSDTRSQAISSGQTNLAEWREAMSTGNYSKLGIDQSIGQSVATNYNKEQQAQNQLHAGSGLTGLRSNTNATNAGMGGSIGASTGKMGGLSLSAGAHGDTGTAAQDSLQANQDRGRSENFNNSVALTKALSDTMSQYQNTSAGKQASSDLSRSLSTQQSYQKTLSEVQSTSDAASQGVHESSSFVDLSSKIGSEEIAWQQKTNPEYAAFQAIDGRKFNDNAAAGKYLATASSDANSGSTGRLVGDSAGQEAINRHRAAVMLAQDQSAKPEDRLAAARYLTDEGRAMQHMRFDPTNTGPMNMDIAAPADRTGVNSGGLQGAANSRTPGAIVPAVPTTQRSPFTAPAANDPVAAAHRRASGVTHHDAGRSPSPVSAGAAPAASATRATPTAPASPQIAGVPSLPVAPAPQFNLAPDLKREVETRVPAAQRGIEKQVTGAEHLAADSGLDANGHGTVARTAANVADNVVDAGRSAGASSRTRLGNTDTPAKPTPTPPAAEPKSRFVRRGPG